MPLDGMPFLPWVSAKAFASTELARFQNAVSNAQLSYVRDFFVPRCRDALHADYIEAVQRNAKEGWKDLPLAVAELEEKYGIEKRLLDEYRDSQFVESQLQFMQLLSARQSDETRRLDCKSPLLNNVKVPTEAEVKAAEERTADAYAALENALEKAEQ